jgi:hypothetical protein
MFKKLLFFVLAILLVTVGLTFTNRFSHLRNFATWGVHTIHDYKTHPVRKVEKGGLTQVWTYDSAYNQKQIPQEFMTIIDSNDTHAFLVIQLKTGL